MIISSSKDIEIFYNEEFKDPNSDMIHTNYHNCQAIRITKDMIPEVLFIKKNEYYNNVSEMPDETHYEINLKKFVSVKFNEVKVAEIFLEIFSKDFENVNIKKDYPEIFL